MLANKNVFRFNASVGANIGDLRAQVTWYYRHGYDIGPAAGLVGQMHVGDYNVFNLFFKYDVPGEGISRRPPRIALENIVYEDVLIPKRLNAL